jgi:hypothetical protein
LKSKFENIAILIYESFSIIFASNRIDKIIIIKVLANAKKANIDKLFKELNKHEKPFDARGYIGKIKFKGDILAFQRDLR